MVLALKTAPAVRYTPAVERARLCAEIADDNKGRDILILDMRGITPIYDFLVLVTGVGRRQLHAIAEEIDAVMRGQGEIRRGIEGYESSKWIVQDYDDVVVHVFEPESREYYDLEHLWADAKRVDWRHA